MNRILRVIAWSVLVSCVGIAIAFAAKPSNTPVTVTFRSGPAAALDGVRGDGFAHDANIDSAGSVH